MKKNGKRLPNATEDSRAKFLQALEANAYNITAACRSTNTGRATVYLWKDKYPEFASALVDLRETMVDNVESALYKGALEGDTTAQIFMMKTLGRKRGYIERPQAEDMEGQVTKIILVAEQKYIDAERSRELGLPSISNGEPLEERGSFDSYEDILE